MAMARAVLSSSISSMLGTNYKNLMIRDVRNWPCRQAHHQPYLSLGHGCYSLGEREFGGRRLKPSVSLARPVATSFVIAGDKNPQPNRGSHNHPGPSPIKDASIIPQGGYNFFGSGGPKLGGGADYQEGITVAKDKKSATKHKKNALGPVSDGKIGKRKADTLAKKERLAKTHPDKPKRPLTDFFIFLEEFRKTFREENPKVRSATAVTKAAGLSWKSMTDAEKAPYEAIATKKKSDYKILMDAYNMSQAENA
ncbi:hypothetical protein RJ639_022889 [Escallonia herrerae]|uniref:HMG box domain-containing protein n=1 Tax=Escallonia herrerae TaxID=1293975 RepID=A0AA88V119_9ASTE|nr:hypothetical protein RJ639_022889 [Escallonia herrerae]